MTDDGPTDFLPDVQVRLQSVEDLLMSMDWEGIAVRTAHGSFQWRLGAVEEPRKVPRKSASTRRKGKRGEVDVDADRRAPLRSGA